jgi:hypothetical protein
MEPIPVTLGMRSNPGRYGQDSAARLINCYAEDAGDEGKIRFPIYASDGFDTFSTLAGAGGVRAMLNLNDDTLYVVAGRVLYRVSTAGVATPVGGFETDGHVFMARNRRSTPHIGIVSDGLYYIISNNVLSQINDSDLPAPNSITSIDGYFVLTIEDGRFFITSIDDGTAIDGLDFAAAEANPDGLMVAGTRGRELVLFGPRSIEFHTNTGNADFPFERVQAINIGCWTAGSMCETTFIREGSAADTIIWAGTDAQGAYAGVMMLEGYGGAKISSHAVDRDIVAEPDKDDIRAYTWSSGGHTFYCITGTTFTWTYDTVTGFWHERESYGLDRWRISAATTFNGKNIVGDYASGILYEMRADLCSEAGRPLVMTVQPPAVHAWPHPMRFYNLFVDTIPGVGLNTTDTHNASPMLMVSHSNDGGKTWSSERTAEVGAIGNFKKRVKFSRFGKSREDGKVFRFSCSADVFKGITGMAVVAKKVGA